MFKSTSLPSPNTTIRGMLSNEIGAFDTVDTADTGGGGGTVGGTVGGAVGDRGGFTGFWIWPIGCLDLVIADILICELGGGGGTVGRVFMVWERGDTLLEVDMREIFAGGGGGGVVGGGGGGICIEEVMDDLPLV